MRANLFLTCLLAFGLYVPVFSQPVDAALHGKWVSDDGETTLVISNNNVKFISRSDPREFSLSWINLPPKNGSAPESKVSEDGEFNACFYVSATSSKNELRTELFEAMLDLMKQKKEGQISQEELNDRINGMGDALKIINNLSEAKFKIFTCRQYTYSLESKSYDEIGSGDVATYFFDDQSKIYEWVENFTLGVLGVSAYSKKK